MNEDPKCTKCVCHRGATHRCLAGRVNLSAPIMVLLGIPNYVEDRNGQPMSSDAVRLIDFMFARMSIGQESYSLEYVLKCYPAKGKPPGKKYERLECVTACDYKNDTIGLQQPATIVGLGSLPCEFLTSGTKIGEWNQSWWTSSNPLVSQFCNAIWIGPNPVAVLMNPTDSPDLYRILWRAAEYVGLEPCFNPKVKMFDWSDFIK
jgi:uracil-DNA glycosylase family 4